MAGAPRLNVAPPSFTPLPYGLLSSLWDQVRRPDDPHWTSGVTWESVCAQGGTTYDECWAVTGTGAAPAAGTKASTTSITRRGALPFTVYAEIDCSAVGFWDRAQDLVSDALTQSEQWQVENAIWTGQAGGQPVVWPRLASNAPFVEPTSGITLGLGATVVSGNSAAMDLVEGWGLLEQALADCYDGVGVIHAPRNLIAQAVHSNLIEDEGNRYRSAGGNLVVFGAGYRGTSPSGTATSGQTWIYATGAMFVYRGPQQIIPVRASFDRAENTIKQMTERTYLVGWDCCQLGVNISTGGIVTGAVGSAT